MADYSKILRDYGERIGRIALFEPYFSIAGKRKKDEAGISIDFPDLMMVTLLFLFENMLSRTYKIGIREISAYLKEVSKHKYKLKDADYTELAETIITWLRPKDGKKNKLQYYNFESAEGESCEYNLIKVIDWDREKNVQYYALDEQGLEFIFATKEYYSEFSLSISQLILRKQLEKGEFHLALRQIDEMHINVNSIRTGIKNIKHEIIGNIVSDDVYERYKNLIDATYQRLVRENAEFEDLKTFVEDTNANYQKNSSASAKDIRAYKILQEVSINLNEVHNLHMGLLKDSLDLKTTAIVAARDALYYSGVSSFNFDQDIVKKIVTTPLPIRDIKDYINPFLSFAKPSIFSPLSLFAKQRIKRRDLAGSKKNFYEINKKIESREIKYMQEMYFEAFSIIYSYLDDAKIPLESIAKDVEAEGNLPRFIAQFFVVLHQMSPVNIRKVIKSRENVLSDACAIIDPKYSRMRAIKLNGNLELGNVKMSNMMILLDEDEDE